MSKHSFIASKMTKKAADKPLENESVSEREDNSGSDSTLSFFFSSFFSSFFTYGTTAAFSFFYS
jgi:hypothetical protein